ncbi:MAG: hypothetical protein ABGZ53_20075 [Fuerstiella sp.]
MNAETTHFDQGQLQRFLDADLSEAELLAADGIWKSAMNVASSCISRRLMSRGGRMRAIS